MRHFYHQRIFLLFLLGLLIISCSKENILEEELNSLPNPQETSEESNLGFITLAENYSDINKSTGAYKSNEYFDNYLDKSYVSTNLSTRDDDSFYSAFHNDTAILDLDGDGKQDIIAFATSFQTGYEYGTFPGKFIIISDYKGVAIKRVFDSTINYGSKIEVNDFNGDGVSDALVYAFNTRSNYYNSTEEFGAEDRSIPPQAPKLIYFDSDINIIDVGMKADHHSGTSGDIDNDGDVDFIQFTYPSFWDWNDTSVLKTPAVLQNSNGEFTKVDLITDLGEQQWYASAVELFDVNNDGFLDLLAARKIGDVKTPQLNPLHISNSFGGPIILFGDGSGTFSIGNSTVLEETVLKAKNYEVVVLGFSFSDIDLDGDIDIILTTTRSEPDGTFEDHTYYDNYHFVLYENNNNGSYVDRTDRIVGNFGIDLPNFYSIKVVDIDKDGDYDLIPDKFANMSSFKYANNIFWENINGTYIRN